MSQTLQLLEALRGVNTDRLDTDEAVLLYAASQQLVQTYSGFSLPTPVWLTDAAGALKKEIQSRREDELQRRLKSIKAQREQLKTADEKRKDLAAEEEAILQQLGLTTTS